MEITSLLYRISVPESTFKKKISSVTHHYARKGVGFTLLRITYINTKMNPADIFTKNPPAGVKRYKKVRMLLFDI